MWDLVSNRGKKGRQTKAAFPVFVWRVTSKFKCHPIRVVRKKQLVKEVGCKAVLAVDLKLKHFRKRIGGFRHQVAQITLCEHIVVSCVECVSFLSSDLNESVFFFEGCLDHTRGLRPNENELSHRWRRRAWQTWKTVS
jgi:hypothetical protein